MSASSTEPKEALENTKDFSESTKNDPQNPKTPQISSLSLENLQNGDLIFVESQKDDLSGAIRRSTKVSKETNFDHVGLIEKNAENDLFVLHSAPKGGSQREEIRHFYDSRVGKAAALPGGDGVGLEGDEKNIENDSKVDKNKIVIYRLKPQYQYRIPEAIKRAQTMLGKPYNTLYIQNEEEYYCSDFIERIFRNEKNDQKDENIFELILMNFKNKKTDQIDDFWVEFYRQNGIDVPQDQPGTNPNQLATSTKLDKVGELEL
jgi:hypothetical protein